MIYKLFSDISGIIKKETIFTDIYSDHSTIGGPISDFHIAKLNQMLSYHQNLSLAPPMIKYYGPYKVSLVRDSGK